MVAEPELPEEGGDVGRPVGRVECDLNRGWTEESGIAALEDREKFGPAVRVRAASGHRQGHHHAQENCCESHLHVTSPHIMILNEV
jgi:hypothetical protein